MSASTTIENYLNTLKKRRFLMALKRELTAQLKEEKEKKK
jgi:hypothetical protein